MCNDKYLKDKLKSYENVIKTDFHDNELAPEKCSCMTYTIILLAEAVDQRCSVKKVLLEISQNSQENACARGACEFCEISENNFFTEPYGGCFWTLYLIVLIA